MRKNYATQLTKEDLLKMGIEDVSVDGKHIWRHGKEINIYLPKNARYYIASFYDPELRANTPISERTNSTGTRTIPVHVINYVWNVSDRAEGLVIDHIDNNPLNNHIDNLQLITQEENLSKERGISTKQIKCKLNKPLSFYEDKLNMYLERYEEAKTNHDADLAHKLRVNIADTRARIRYYLAHIDEAKELQNKEKPKKYNVEYHQRAETIRKFKSNIDKKRSIYTAALAEYGPEDHWVLQFKYDWKMAVYEYKKWLEENNAKPIM